jgi:flagellin
MGLRIQNNIAALNAQKNLSTNSLNLSKSLERLSSGFRINRAADDAAGLAISQQFRADIASYKVASQNVTEANSLLQVAEGATDQVGNMMTRLKELATQASSANAGSNITKINAEGNQLIDEIDRIANSTEYAGSKLLNGTFGVSASSGGTFTAGAGYSSASGMEGSKTYTIVATTVSGGKTNVTISATLSSGRVSETLYDVNVPATGATGQYKFSSLGLSVTFNEHLARTAGSTVISNAGTAADFQVGAKNTADDRIGITLTSVTSSALGLSKDKLDTAAEAKAFLTTVDNAISTLNAKRGDIGAAQNRLTYASSVLTTTIENNVAAESAIRDVDMAAEMTTFTKTQILMQAGTAMLAQANSSPQLVLSLFK